MECVWRNVADEGGLTSSGLEPLCSAEGSVALVSLCVGGGVVGCRGSVDM